MPRKPKQKATPNVAPAPPAASDANSTEDTHGGANGPQDSPQASQDATQAQPESTGDAPKASSAADPDLARALSREVPKRFMREKRWFGELADLRDQMMKDAKASGMAKEAAQLWTYSELDRLYPPLAAGAKPEEKAEKTPSENPIKWDNSDSGGRVQGLADIPENWGELPSNASMSAEIAWVQAERLRIVEERPNGQVVVRLDRSRSPAPSWAALSWLETSIRSYAKFVEVAAKAAGGANEDQDMVRRERMQIEEIRALLLEMKDAGKAQG